MTSVIYAGFYAALAITVLVAAGVLLLSAKDVWDWWRR
jgi:hypothetical protein